MPEILLRRFVWYVHALNQVLSHSAILGIHKCYFRVITQASVRIISLLLQQSKVKPRVSVNSKDTHHTNVAELILICLFPNNQCHFCGITHNGFWLQLITYLLKPIISVVYAQHCFFLFLKLHIRRYHNYTAYIFCCKINFVC